MENINQGDKIKVIFENKIIEGVFVSSENKFITIKINSGYNLILEKRKIKNLELVEKKQKEKKEKKTITKNPSLPNVLLLHTGGTIASKVDYSTGAVTSRFSPEDIIEMFPEAMEIANIESRLIRQMWSDDLRFKHFSILAEEIQKQIKNYDGIIITMGTDNLAVASSALAFIIQKSPIPILLIGAQRSSDRPSSDAKLNLLSALKFIAKSDFSGVAICMHSSSSDDCCSILPPTKTRKLHTSKRNAFKPVNDTEIAKVYDEKIVFLKKDYLKKDPSRDPIIKPYMEDKVGLLKIHINMFPEQFKFYKKYNGLVIEGTGLGHTPGDVIDDITEIHKDILPIIKKLAKKMPVVMTSQCLFGRVNMNVYSKGRELLKAGVICGEDMLPETALVKLSWLLGNFSKEETKKLISKNLVGEINQKLTL